RRWRRSADAGDLAHESPRPPAGHGNAREQFAVATGDRRTARLPNGCYARWGKSHACRNQTVARAYRWADPDPWQVGPGRSRAIEPDRRAIPGNRASRDQRWPVVW